MNTIIMTLVSVRTWQRTPMKTIIMTLVSVQTWQRSPMKTIVMTLVSARAWQRTPMKTIIMTCFRANLTEDINEKYYNDACFSYFQTIWHLFFDFLMLQDKYHIRKLLVNIKLICTCCETGQNISPKAQFSTRF